jgi:hypothetical protein
MTPTFVCGGFHLSVSGPWCDINGSFRDVDSLEGVQKVRVIDRVFKNHLKYELKSNQIIYRKYDIKSPFSKMI